MFLLVSATKVLVISVQTMLLFATLDMFEVAGNSAFIQASLGLVETVGVGLGATGGRDGVPAAWAGVRLMLSKNIITREVRVNFILRI